MVLIQAFLDLLPADLNPLFNIIDNLRIHLKRYTQM